MIKTPGPGILKTAGAGGVNNLPPTAGAPSVHKSDGLKHEIPIVPMFENGTSPLQVMKQKSLATGSHRSVIAKAAEQNYIQNALSKVETTGYDLELKKHKLQEAERALISLENLD